jgi:hypothetical protein
MAAPVIVEPAVLDTMANKISCFSQEFNEIGRVATRANIRWFRSRRNSLGFDLERRLMTTLGTLGKALGFNAVNQKYLE